MAAASSQLRGARWQLLALLLCALRVSSFAPRSAPRSAARRSAPLRAAATDEAYDAVIIGSGFGGLCCGALLAHYGQRVVVLESHEHVGGCAHGFRRGAYTLDSGPSLWAGCSVPSTSPLRQVMDAVGAEVDWVTYDGWGVHDLRAGEAFRMSVGPEAFEAVVRQYGDVGQWRRLLAAIEPVVDASMACPPMALRADPLGFLRTALGPYLLRRSPTKAAAFMPDLLTGPAAALADLADVDDAFVLKWLDYLAFALSGRPADDTVGAAVAYTLGDLHRPGAFLDYPVGGSGAVAEALAASIAKAGSEVRTRAHVAEILVEGNGGARLRDGSEGFLGDDAAAIDARENMYIISIPSLFDAALSPEGKHVAHCYAAAHEPFEAWEHLDRTSQEYKAKKEAAAAPRARPGGARRRRRTRAGGRIALGRSEPADTLGRAA
ncbi:all-trans-retinol 13,14-reductase [Aureococcus anophagefferens]|nr:all-trans-retinol 13,14-reductase [Aureococcus anophagefferens]